MRRMLALLLSNLPSIISAAVAAIPTLLLVINTIVNSRTHKPLELIDPAISLLGITYTALETPELRAFQRLKLRKWTFLLAFILITYIAIYLFIDVIIINNYLLFLYVGVVAIVSFFLFFVCSRLRWYSFFRGKEYLSSGLPAPNVNVEVLLFRKAELLIQADYSYLIAKCYQALKASKIQIVTINSDDELHNSSLSSARIAIDLAQTARPGIYKISIEPILTGKKANDREESSKSIEALLERILDVPDNYTSPVNLHIRVEP